MLGWKQCQFNYPINNSFGFRIIIWFLVHFDYGHYAESYCYEMFCVRVCRLLLILHRIIIIINKRRIERTKHDFIFNIVQVVKLCVMQFWQNEI